MVCILARVHHIRDPSTGPASVIYCTTYIFNYINGFKKIFLNLHKTAENKCSNVRLCCTFIINSGKDLGSTRWACDVRGARTNIYRNCCCGMEF